jgi:hypothetical protein
MHVFLHSCFFFFFLFFLVCCLLLIFPSPTFFLLLLCQQDYPTLMSALRLADELMTKLPDLYRDLFVREGMCDGSFFLLFFVVV